ncbi:MAG: ADP-ribosylglycohydrolase family protein, partial [Rhodospirillales bacterium]|nr:ADP-ribosylglycohydrolase family protein [Rhodospirillales bacterium]
RFGGPDRIIANPPAPRLYYTDDTQMAIGVTETLIDCDGIDPDHLAQRFAQNFQHDRGYGPATYDLLLAIRDGGDWRELASALFAGSGSFGNGAAMRVAPIGIAFSSDLHKVAEYAECSARITHTHPVGVDGAKLIAIATALASQAENVFDRQAFFSKLLDFAETEAFREQLERAGSMSALDPVSQFGTGVEAQRSVATAIACFAATPDDYAETVSYAISLGGDTDTIAAMAGAIAGARLGVESIPTDLIDRLEDYLRGRTYLLELANKLAAKYTSG